MSEFEIAHLKQCYRDLLAECHRKDLIILALTMHGVTQKSRSFHAYMCQVPAHLIPSNPDRINCMKHYKDFEDVYNEWMKLDDECSFVDYLEIKNGTYDK